VTTEFEQSNYLFASFALRHFSLNAALPCAMAELVLRCVTRSSWSSAAVAKNAEASDPCITLSLTPRVTGTTTRLLRSATQR